MSGEDDILTVLSTSLIPIRFGVANFKKKTTTLSNIYNRTLDPVRKMRKEVCTSSGVDGRLRKWPNFADQCRGSYKNDPAISLHSHHVSLVQWTKPLLSVTRDLGSNPLRGLK
jgi:hypothetical protein